MWGAITVPRANVTAALHGGRCAASLCRTVGIESAGRRTGPTFAGATFRARKAGGLGAWDGGVGRALRCDAGRSLSQDLKTIYVLPAGPLSPPWSAWSMGQWERPEVHGSQSNCRRASVLDEER